MEFIREQQAQGAARIGQLEDIVVRFARATRDRFEATDRFAQATRDRFEATDQRVDDVALKIAALVDSQIRAEERGKKIDEKIAELVNSQRRTEENVMKTDENIKKTDENVKNTEENVKKTDEALRKLIVTVDRHLSEGRNGNSKNSKK